MESSVVSTIEKIKQQEQNKELKLKEKREYETTIASLHRAIREATTQAEKSEQEQQLLINKTNTLQVQIMLGKIRRNALLDQLHTMKKELEELRNKSNAGISTVWKERSTFCKEIQSTSDKYDVWALLTKPVSTEIAKISKEPINYDKLMSENQNRLEAALQRRNKCVAERDRLKAEPECGEEFVRNTIKNNKLHKFYCTQVKDNEPVKFSTSEAARRKLPSVFKNKKAESMPWYQPYSVVGSVAVFLIYFCVLREESDVDVEFNKTLYDRIQGLEKHQLLQAYRYNKENGLSVEDIEKRLQEIELQEANVAA